MNFLINQPHVGKFQILGCGKVIIPDDWLRKLKFIFANPRYPPSGR